MKIMYPETAIVEERNPFLKIERVGRTCYKSESEFTEETAFKFSKC